MIKEADVKAKGARALRVVWFDDKPSGVERPVHYLRERGFEVDLLSDPEEVRDLFTRDVSRDSAQLPDVFVTDLMVEYPGSSLGEESGFRLALFADGLYQQQLGLRCRVGISSVHPREIQSATSSPDLTFAFAYKTYDICDGKVQALVQHVNLSGIRFRRDLWCANHLRANPVVFDTAAGRLRPEVFYGVFHGIKHGEAVLEVWSLQEVGSERIIELDPESLKNLGPIGYLEPIRVFEIYDVKDARNVHPMLHVDRLDVRPTMEYMALRPGIDLTCLPAKDNEQARPNLL